MFDRVPHHHLITTLSSIGIHSTLLTWFASYLTNRSQRVVLDGHSSATSPASSGVPQGSILGPLLFSIYLSPLANIPLSRNSKLIMYAGDTNVDQVAAWITSVGLSLNCNKTKLMVLSHKRSPPTVHVRLPNASVIPIVTSTVGVEYSYIHYLCQSQLDASSASCIDTSTPQTQKLSASCTNHLSYPS